MKNTTHLLCGTSVLALILATGACGNDHAKADAFVPPAIDAAPQPKVYRQIEHLARPGINEALLISNDFLNGYNATAPSFTGVDAATLGKVKDEAKTVLKALYLGTCLINGLKSLDADSGFHPGGVKCGAVGGAVFDADGVTISAAAATGAQTYADKVFDQFEPDVMRVDTGLAKSNYFALCGDATTAPLLCGGRFLNDDVIDVTYSYLLSGADPRAPLDGSASSDPLVNQLKALVSDGVQYSSNPAQNNDNATAPDPTNPNQFHPNISQGFPYSAAPF